MAMLKQSKKAPKEVHPIHVKKGDTVLVITGKDKGKTGLVKYVFGDRMKVLIDGVNIIKKAVRPNPMAGQRGGIIEMEAPLFASKVMLYCLKCNKPTRIKKTTLEEAGKPAKRVRVCQHCKEQLDV